MRDVAGWKALLRAELREAQLARRSEVVAVLRETLAAIDNAEAVEPGAAPEVKPGVIAGGVAGLGAGEVPRRVLTPPEVAAIVAGQIEERRQAADRYEALGRPEEASRLRRQLAVLVGLS